MEINPSERAYNQSMAKEQEAKTALDKKNDQNLRQWCVDRAFSAEFTVDEAIVAYNFISGQGTELPATKTPNP